MSLTVTEAFRVAAFAHDLWSSRLRHSGWSLGERFDPASHHDDRLCGFAELSPAIQREAVAAIVTDDLAEQLVASIHRRPRTPRELEARDMAVGVAVTLIDTPEARGHIQSWTLDESFPGCLRSITVRWADGESVAYSAAERMLVLTGGTTTPG